MSSHQPHGCKGPVRPLSPQGSFLQPHPGGWLSASCLSHTPQPTTLPAPKVGTHKMLGPAAGGQWDQPGHPGSTSFLSVPKDGSLSQPPVSVPSRRQVGSLFTYSCTGPAGQELLWVSRVGWEFNPQMETAGHEASLSQRVTQVRRRPQPQPHHPF